MAKSKGDHLLDTNALIFFLQGSPRLPAGARRVIEEPDATSWVSLVSLWEISIKASIGKLQVDFADRADLPSVLRAAGFELINVTWPAIRRASSLPMHHRDPFDRLLVAEALLREVPLISCDRQLDAYDIERWWG